MLSDTLQSINKYVTATVEREKSTKAQQPINNVKKIIKIKSKD